jgi:hypothetical protein
MIFETWHNYEDDEALHNLKIRPICMQSSCIKF